MLQIKVEEILKKESKAFKNLLEAIEAYREAKSLGLDKIAAVCKKSIMLQTLAIAEKKEDIDPQFLKVIKLQDPTSFDWINIIYTLADNSPSIKFYLDDVYSRILN